MNINTEFDLKTFQSEVLNDFNGIKATIGFSNFYKKGYESPEKFKKISNEPNLKIGFITKIFLKLISGLGKRADKNILSEPKFIELENKAAKIVNNPKIKSILCSALKKEVKSDLFKEAKEIKLIKVVTALLAEKRLVEEFSIERNVRLFALIALKIGQKGVSKYCR